MEFKSKIKMRMFVMAVYIVIGAVMCVLGYGGITESDYVATWGTALFVCGIFKIIQYAMLMKNTEKMQKLAIAEKEERNIMIYEKARSLAFAIYHSGRNCDSYAVFARI